MQIQLSAKGFKQTRVVLLAANWERRVDDLLRFHRKHGHFDVPVRYASNPSLGAWTNGQRGLLRNGKMLPYRKQRLERLGFSWVYRAPHGDEHWDGSFGQLVKFHQKFGHFNIPHQGSTGSLYRWLICQRLAIESDNLCDYRRQRLEQLGLNPRLSPFRSERSWNQNFDQIVDFHRLNGHFKISKNAKGSQRLRSWMTTQRCLKKVRRLRPDYEQRLNAIGFIWEPDPAAKMNS